MKALSEAELRRLLVAVAPEWQLLVELLASTGLRISEALALTWADLDLGKRQVRVRRRVRGGDTDAPKSKYARRTVPLPPVMARHLWTARQGASDSALVFTYKGEPIQRTAPFRAVRAAAKRAGIGDWPGLHTMRHTYASILFSRGASVVAVQRALGHHSPGLTLATYIHLLPGDEVDTAFLDELLPPLEPRPEPATAVPLTVTHRA